MIRLLSVVILAFAYFYVGVIDIYAQDLTVPTGWQKISVCEIKLLIPIDLKNQYAKGIDSCVVSFKSTKMRIGIDYGSYGNAYKNDGTKVDFKEEFKEIDSKKAQLVTYKDARNGREFTAGLYVVIYEAQDRVKTSLNMTVETKSEKELETAKQIFQSILFVKSISFFGGVIDVFGNYKKEESNGPDFGVEYISLNKPESNEKAFLGIYSGNNPNFNPPKNAKTKKAKFGNKAIKWHIWKSRKGNEFYYNYETLILDEDGNPANHLFVNGTNKQRVQELLKAIGSYRIIKK
jgi:hypothetical protein